MKNAIEKIQNATVSVLLLTFAAMMAVFGFALMGGLFALGLIMLPIATLILALAPKTEPKAATE